MSKDGMNYAPEAPTEKVVGPGEFVFAASHFDHGHIYGQTRGLANAGGTCKWVFAEDESKLEPLKDLIAAGTRVAARFEDILDDPEVRLVTSAAVPNRRAEIGFRVMDAGKDYFTDKSPFTTLDQLAAARKRVEATGRKYMVCYSERLQNEAAWHAGALIRDGAVGRVLQVLNLAPHNLAGRSRPAWFFDKEAYGGIITDIGSHQFEQFLEYAGAADGEVLSARVENFAHPDTPGLEDFGEANLRLDTGASAYCRMDWFNPAKSRVWGDGRTFILGEKGYMELRKYIDVCREGGGNRILLVNDGTETEIECEGKVGYPFFGGFILDCLNRTEKAMTQAHAFKAAELSMLAQKAADERNR
ncbi:MAG: Gfo/Idh/MocA family protein [Puniceicoccaceae bacterium]